MKEKTIYELLGELTDKRRAQGKRHSLQTILLIVIMGIMSGSKSERSVSRFAQNNKEDLIKYLAIKRKEIPTRNVMRGVIQALDFLELEAVFHKWAKKHIEIEKKDWLSIDGKAIRGTVKNTQDKLHNFKSLVSIFASKKKQVISARKIETKKESEIPMVKKLIKELELENVIFTLDALHCQKETVKTIIESKNDFVIGLKGNQKKLLNQVKKTL